jgi:Tol biopolymer transport system component/tRNA A-37 threonylcarbamoyl transferase component Bud32
MSDGPTERLAAALADRYRLERELGQGGMATVYLAEDLRHDRQVAIKVLRPELAAVLGAERFVVEIKTTAQFQHPHILPLFDSGSAEGFLYYVMPYVEGETLRTRLDREKQLGIEEAVKITTEVADALDYAHRHGVIHRDIKPENILLHDGWPMVADFGIALALSAAAGGRMTETGMSLGTPHYMSPEQATAEKEITARSDVYSLASVLYEMLAGQPPHLGGTAQQIIMKIIAEPVADVTALRKSVPPNVAAALVKALEKLPADRFETAKVFAEALNNPHFTTGRAEAAGALTPAEARGLRGALRNPWSWGAVAVAAGAVALSVITARRAAHATAAPVSRFVTDLQDFNPTNSEGFAISPDGAYIAYTGADNKLLLRGRDQLEAAPLPGGENGYGPFFSPDGRMLAYCTGYPGTLRVTPVAGGAATTLVRDSAYAQGGSWSDDGWIYFIAGASQALLRVRADGGAPQLVARPDSARDELFYIFPWALPGGRAVLMTIRRRQGEADIAAVDVGSGKVTVLTPGVLAMYAPMGYLIVLRSDGSLRAARFDPRHLALTGHLETVLDDVWPGSTLTGEAIPGLSSTGTLIYQRPPPDRQVVRVGRDGAEQALDPNWSGAFDQLSVSPDGSRLAVVVDRAGRAEVWVRSLATGTFTRLAFEGTWDYRPSWTPDGRSLLFISDRSGRSAVYREPADGSGSATLVRDDPHSIDEGVLSADGRWLIYRRGTGAGRDLYAARIGADSTPVPVATSSFEEYAPALSPDGRWVAYVSNETDPPQVYVRPFPAAAGARWQVSRAGGREPMWSHSGRELFYRSAAGDLVAATIAPGASFRVVSERALFSARAYMSDFLDHAYDVSPDDRSFLFIRIPPSADSPLVVVLNWFEELKAKVGK